MSLPDTIKRKLQSLPDQPGVYLMRDRHGRIIYVGKAASLRGRVRSYFQQGTLRSAPPKLRSMIHSICDLEVLPLRSEADAIVTEGRLIKEYRPYYNVSFRDDKRFLLLKVSLQDPLPRFETGRIEKNDGATYFGPYSNTRSARAALDFIEKRFGLRRCPPLQPGPEDYRHCHNDIVRHCSAPCIARVTPDEYRARVEEAIAFLRGERPEVLAEVEAAMTAAAAERRFEQAAAHRDLLLLLRKAIRERSHGRKSLDLRAEEARAGVAELQQLLGLALPPRSIECFDISNISGTHAVASLVCAVDGLPQPNRYRHFRIKTVEGSDDPAMMAEAVRRRYRRLLDEQAALPDLVLADGGVTQLGAMRRELAGLGLGALPTCGLAKRFEEIHVSENMSVPPLRLPADSQALRVLQRLRDEAHRFALSYHRTLRQRRIRDSVLDEIEGIGDKRKRLLISHFGSVLRMRRASANDIAAVPGIGPILAAQIKAELDRRHPQPS